MGGAIVQLFWILLLRMAYKSLSSITVLDIESHGIEKEEATTLHQRLTEIIKIHGGGTPATWQHLSSSSFLSPELPFSFHQMLYYGCYKDFGPDPPAWIPEPYVVSFFGLYGSYLILGGE